VTDTGVGWTRGVAMASLTAVIGRWAWLQEILLLLLLLPLLAPCYDDAFAASLHN